MGSPVTPATSPHCEPAHTRPRAWRAAAAACLACAAAIAWLQWRDPADVRIHGTATLALLGAWAVAWAVALLCLSRGGAGSMRAVWIVAIALRVLLLPATPPFSGDVWRYLWEGKVLAAGFSPYALAPEAYAGSWLAAGDGLWRLINHPEIPAIYPPGAQAVFQLVARLWYAPVAMKAAMVVFDLGVLFLLGELLRRRGRDPRWALVWAWSPLVVFEVAGSGHLDVMAALFILIWLERLEGRREVTASVALGFAIAAKLVPALLLPVALRWHRRRWTVLLAPLVAGAMYVPFLDLRTALRPGPGATVAERLGLGPVSQALHEYGTRWRHNESVFWPLYEAAIGIARAATPDGVDWSTATGTLQRAAVLARAADEGRAGHRDNSAAFLLARRAAGALFLLGLGAVIWRARSPEGAALGTLGLWIVLSPVVHPWYLLMLIPLATLSRRWSWIVLGTLSLLTYATVEHFLATGEWHESWGAWGVQCGVFAVLLARELAVHRFTPISPDRRAVT